MIFSRKHYGEASEQLAARYLRKHGHRIVCTNFHSKQGEIDIISEIGEDTLVFTEVRSKHRELYGHPAETIDFKKQEKIRRTAEIYLYKTQKYQNYICRFDVITIVGEGEEAKLTYFPDAF